MRPRHLIGLGALIVAVAALAVFGLAGKKTPPAGRRAPALPREQLVAGPATIPAMAASAHGRPFAVVFWASWCGPCIREAPAFESFARSAQGSGRVVGVDWSDARSNAEAFIRSHHWTFPVVRDGEGLVGNDYELTVLPTTFVLDSHGRIRARLIGPQTKATLAHALARAEAS